MKNILNTKTEKLTKPIKKNTDYIDNSEKQRSISPEQRHAMIAEAAYYISEKIGFDPACTDDCWIKAEREIDLLILDL